METTKEIKQYYDENVETEWGRIHNRPEFLLTCRFIDRYIKPGDTVLDIGGGPGRYSIYLANKGCDVTLLDLSPGNVKFAAEKAQEEKVIIKAVEADAREARESVEGKFDHVLLMGPMYHLLEEEDRVKALESALKCLRPGGKIYVSFINMFAAVIYTMKFAPEMMADPLEQELHKLFIEGKSYAGDAFTKAYFAKQSEILPFMERFPLEKMHLFSQEGIMSPCEGNIMSQNQEIVDLWLNLCEKTCEREDLLSWGEHLMYIGKYCGE
jgi:2-polyprenyl-3-methyl-5-hydroxy-6-metoxy-1,4-benzoquinol methylase